MRTLINTFIRFHNHHGAYFVSLQEYMNSHQDTYQDDHDDFLYEWVDIGRGWQYVPIT